MLTDLVTGSMKGFGGRTLHERELQGMLVTLLMGGTETTLNMVDSGMWLLLEHPDLLAELRADHSLIPNFVEEALRIESPVQQLSRRAVVDTEIGGVSVPAGSRISIFYAAANRDSSHWDEPDTFDIHREEAKRHVGFGGRRALLHRGAAGADGGLASPSSGCSRASRTSATAPARTTSATGPTTCSAASGSCGWSSTRRRGHATGACALQSKHGIDEGFRAEGACSRPAGDPPGG